MRPFFHLTLLLLLTLSSCQEDSDALPLACASNAKAVKKITDASGLVHFDATLNLYIIDRAEPGTYDVVDVGILCNDLPEDLRTANKRVVFSGTYYEYKQPSGAPVGTTYYYLTLSKVKAE